MGTDASIAHWDARWIWDTAPSTDRNVIVHFRHEFTLPQELSAIQLHISADSRYLLFLNGMRVGFGPARAYHFRYEYDTYDATPYLKSGTNVIAILVQHWGEATFQHRVGRGGVLVQLNETASGDLLLGSDASWRVRRSVAYRQNTPRIACQLPWEEQFDARLHEDGWQTNAFDDSSWAHAFEIGPVGTPPWDNLSSRMIPFLTDELVEPSQTWFSGKFRRPEVVVAAHITPYVVPGDLSANRHSIDTILATTLHTSGAGMVTFKMCSLYGTAPRIFIDGEELVLQPASADVEAVRLLSAGTHLLLLDWQGEAHDKDVTVTASGISDLSVAPLPFFSQDSSCIWAIAFDPGAARAVIQAATSIESLQACAVPWQVVAAIDTPPVDVYMDLTASTPLDPQQIPLTFPLNVGPTSVQEAQHYLIDFGREVVGWLELEVEAAAGTILDLVGFEGIQDGEWQLTERMNNSLRYTCRAGRQSYRSMLRRGFRYLLLSVHSGTSTTTLFHLKTALATYPGEQRGAFACSDARLTQIWQMCAYTLRLCTEDTFTDCPAYEQTFWVGDSYTDVMVHAAVHGDMRIVERCMRLCADSLHLYPLTNSQLPSGWDMVIPNWSWFWVLGCAEYYLATADVQFVHDLYPALKQHADFIDQARNAQGLFEMHGVWHFLDWTPIDGGVEIGGPDYIMAHENILGCVVLRQTAEFAQIIGATQDALRWLRVAQELQEAIDRIFWSETAQAYVDSLHDDGTLSTTVSRSTNICALFAHLPQGSRRTALLSALAHPPASWVKVGTPWLFSLYLQELMHEDDVEGMLNLIREHWGPMIEKGATTTWETFPGWEENGRWTRSWCHAWSSIPAYLLSTTVLGIRPLTPGFGRALIAPRPGTLSWALGTMPTPHGDIVVHIEKMGLSLKVALPPTISAQVELPATKQGTRPGQPSITGPYEKVEQHGDTWLIVLPPGASVSIVMPDFTN